MTQEKVFGCHVITPVTSGTVPWSFPCPWAGGRGGGLTPCVDRQLLPRTTAVGSHVPLTLSSAYRSAEPGGRKRQSLEGLTSAYCIYLVVLFSCKESRPSFLKQCCSPGGQGQGAGASALHTFLDSVGFPGLLRPGFPPPSIQQTSSPARGTHCLEKAKPSPCFYFSWCLMICICRIETGKQYINVCANFRSLPHPLPLFIFIYIECVPFNGEMTTLPSVAGKVFLHWVTVVAVTWDPQPSLLSHLTCRPLDWPSQHGMGERGKPGAHMKPSRKLGCRLQQELMLPCPGPWVYSRELGSLRRQPAFLAWLVSQQLPFCF